MVSSKSVNFFILCTIVTLICVIPTVSSIRCYVCNEANDEQCETKIHPGLIKECTPNKDSLPPTGCSLVYLKDENPITKAVKFNIQRGCYYGSFEKVDFSKGLGCDPSILFSYLTMNCTVCTGDTCNNHVVLTNKNGASTKNTFTIYHLIGILSISKLFSLF